MDDSHQVPEKEDIKESVDMEEPPPPYSFSTAISKEAEDAKIQMIPAEAKNQNVAKKSWRLKDVQKIRKRFGWYAGDEKSCPLTWGLIPAQPAALVLALVYIFANLALIVFILRWPDVQPDGFIRGTWTICAAINVIHMSGAFYTGFWRTGKGYSTVAVYGQCGQTAAVSFILAILICVPVLNIVWCVATGAGDTFGMFTEKWAFTFAGCAALTAAAHFLLAVFVRAALAYDHL